MKIAPNAYVHGDHGETNERNHCRFAQHCLVPFRVFRVLDGELEVRVARRVLQGSLPKAASAFVLVLLRGYARKQIKVFRDGRFSSVRREQTLSFKVATGPSQLGSTSIPNLFETLFERITHLVRAIFRCIHRRNVASSHQARLIAALRCLCDRRW